MLCLVKQTFSMYQECLLLFSDPVYIQLPTVNNTGETVFIDWSKSFKLNGPLFEYILYENDFLIFRGISSNSGQLPGRAEKGVCSSIHFKLSSFTATRYNNHVSRVTQVKYSFNHSQCSK